MQDHSNRYVAHFVHWSRAHVAVRNMSVDTQIVACRVWEYGYLQNGEQEFRMVCVSITEMQLLQGTFFKIIVI